MEEQCPCKSIRILKSDNGHFYIYGPASVEIIDKEKDRIRASALELSLPQLLRRGRLSLAHEDVIVGEILPEIAIGDTKYRTAVHKDRLMVLGDVWDDTEASQETRQRIQRGELKSYSISGQIKKGGAKNVCDSTGCYRDVFKLDSHAVTICEEGMNPAAKFEVLQKDASTIAYIPIATPNSNQEASPKEAEVIPNMTEVPTVPIPTAQPPATEAQKADVPVPPAPAPAHVDGGGSVEATLKEMMGMMTKMMSMMGGGGGQPADTMKAAEDTPPAPPEVSVTKDVVAALVEAGVKKHLDEVLKGAKIVQTPRPDQITKEEMNNPFAAIMKDPTRLDKMSWNDIASMEGSP